MLFIAAFVFVYYTIWALLLVRSKFYLSSLSPSPPVLLFSISLWTNFTHNITAIPPPNIYHPLLLPSAKLRHQNPTILVARRYMWGDIVFRKGHASRSEEEEGQGWEEGLRKAVYEHMYSSLSLLHKLSVFVPSLQIYPGFIHISAPHPYTRHDLLSSSRPR